MGQGHAPGKVILVGEHFVVHGTPAITLPLFARGVRVSVVRAPGPWDTPPRVADHVRQLLPLLDEDPEALGVTVTSDLPIGAGLGGSAALAVALVRALDDQGTLTREAVRRRAHELEKVAHGTPSGVDDAVAAYACPVHYVSGSAPNPMEEVAAPRVWVGLTPERTSTMEAVAGVAERAAERPEWFRAQLDEAALISEQTRLAMLGGDWEAVGSAMTRNHGLLQAIGVSTSALDGLVDAALAAGAFGAKLTGGGLGGAAIALAPEGMDLTDVWLAAGAVEVIAP